VRENRLNPEQLFQGRAEQVRQVGSFLVSRYHYAPGIYLDDHLHGGAFVSVVISGRYQETCGPATVTCAQHTVLYHPPEEKHSNDFAGGATILMLELEEAARAAGVRERLLPCRSSLQEARGLGLQIGRELGERCSTSDLIIESLALEMLGNCLSRSRRDRQRTPAWLPKVIEIANDRYGERLTLADVAQRVGIHPMHLAPHFRRRLGCTFGEFLRRIRLSRAEQQLRRTKKALAEIAADCGFADQSHLTRLFAAAFGTTPGRYRSPLK
jgi:AraC family transcriptional regulator